MAREEERAAGGEAGRQGGKRREREVRLARALRENLARRKAQQRGRAEEGAGPPEPEVPSQDK